MIAVDHPPFQSNISPTGFAQKVLLAKKSGFCTKSLLGKGPPVCAWEPFSTKGCDVCFFSFFSFVALSTVADSVGLFAKGPGNGHSSFVFAIHIPLFGNRVAFDGECVAAFAQLH